jgi:SNF5 / SMARCB1 / INI1
VSIEISPRRLLPKDADLPEILVPIRLEFDVDQHKFKEVFLWNLNGKFDIVGEGIIDAK